jgi:hypothetical protein
MMLTGAVAAGRCAAITPDPVTVTLKSRNAGETGFASANWTAQEHPADQSAILLAGGVLGERYRNFELFLAGQTTIPKEDDQLDDGTNLWVIRSMKREQTGNVFMCLCVYAGAG